MIGAFSAAQKLELILPPLTLVQLLSEGKVTPDMKWAIAMADRVKAEKRSPFAISVTAISPDTQCEAK
jgi:hypothetical protein